MYYVYVLRSEKDNKFYIGYTSDLKKRVSDHNGGKVESSRSRRPFVLVYYEASRDLADTLRREKYLKTTYGHRYLHNRIKDYLSNF